MAAPKKTTPENPVSPAADGTTALPLEKAFEELEKITALMEDPKTSLEDMLAHYERGMWLKNACANRLSTIEQRIRIVQEQAGGEVKLVDLANNEVDG